MPLLADKTVETALLGQCNAVYYQPPTFSAGPSVNALVSHIGGVNSIVYRGTDPENIQNWLTDLDSFPVHYPNLGWVHQGFLTAAESGFAQAAAIARLGPYIIGGHSMGGAIAVITAALLTIAGHPPVHISTFGCPNLALDNVLGSLLKPYPGYRWHNGGDPVPDVPPILYQDRPATRIGPPALLHVANHLMAAYQSSFQKTEWT